MRFSPATLLVTLALFAGCAQQPAPPMPAPLTFQRGAQLLAAGSPKSAIPFLTQTIAAAPDGPEPLALLSLAYALDLQDQRAILEAQQVRRPKDSNPGWELVAIAIAQMTRHQPKDAVDSLQHQLAGDPPGSPMAAAVRQYLALAQVLAGQHDQAVQTLVVLSRTDSMRTCAALWTVIIRLQDAKPAEAKVALVNCARLIRNDSGAAALRGNLVQADDQTLYDAAVAAIASGDLDMANGLFARVRAHNVDPADSAVFMALIAGIQHDWASGRTALKEACETGSAQSRGLANQLFSLVCALEDRPDAMIEYMLAGQRMFGRNATPTYIQEQPQPEPVWRADDLK